jgi:hypothetical protein
VGGCGGGRPSADPLKDPEIRALLGRLLEQPPGGTASPELEALLFNPEPVSRYLGRHPLAAHHTAWGALLDRELSRRNLSAKFMLRSGEKTWLRMGKRVLLGRHAHLFVEPAEIAGIQPPEVSMTVQRVGLNHLWARL